MNVPGKLAIVADDFTGANDTGAQFSIRNIRTVSITVSELIRETVKHCDVLVISTESRFDNTDTAYRKVFDTGRIIAEEEEIKYYYKKIDSTMRGNIGAEISAMMDSLELENAFLVPALPEYGRTTVNGMVYINDVLLEDTEFAMDPRNPVNESFIPTILSRQTDKHTAVIIHDHIREGRQKLKENVNFHLSQGTRIIIFDAESDEEIDLISSVITGIDRRVLFAGCSGLAKHLAGYLNITRQKISSVVIAGSVSEVTRSQIDFAVHYLPARLVEIDSVKILTSERPDEMKRILDIVSASSSAGEDLIIRSAPSRTVVSDSIEAGEEAGIRGADVSEMVSSFLGDLASRIIRTFKIKGMLLTGGDTAIKALQALGARELVLGDEIVHGIPCGHFSDESFGNVQIITKAGGFGSEDAIFMVLNYLGNL